MSRRVLLFVLSLAVAGGPGALSSAPAQPSVPAAPPATEIVVVRLSGRPGGAQLLVRGKPIMRLVGARAVTRLRGVAGRMERLLPPPTDVAVRATRRGPQLVVDGQVMITPTRAEVGRQGLPVPLVEQWAQALTEALMIPPITLSRTDLVLSPGRSETVTVATAWAGPVVVGGFNDGVADVRLRDGQADVTGKNVGTTIVPFRIGPYRAQLAVSVRPAAGRIPAEADVAVTGTPATPELIREAIERRLSEVVQRDPGAAMELSPGTLEPLAPGRSLTVAVSVAIRTPYGGPVDGSVKVRITNTPVQLVDPDVLLVSNRPEKITENGLLFQETLEPAKPARLLYHHLNGTPGQTRVLKITLYNSGLVPARVHYLSGHAGPSADPLFIGFASTQRFLDALLAGRGYLVEVPPGSTTTFTAYALPPLALVSGLMQFQVVEGGPVELVVHVRVPWLLDRTVMTDLGPAAFPHPRGTFPGSVVEVAREQPAHQPGIVAELGVMSNFRDVRTGAALVGDYGVLYRVRMRLVNSTDREVTTSLIANAAGGLARGLFYVNGTAVDIGLVKPYEDREVAAFTVPPGNAREVLVLTMPVAGSYYPVRLGLRPR